MSSKRARRRRRCDGKVRHATEDAAQAALAALRGAHPAPAGSRPLEVYPCACGGWHLGHHPGAGRKHRTDADSGP